MAIIGRSGALISFDSMNLIEDVNEDISEGVPLVVAYYTWHDGIKIYEDYDTFYPQINNFEDSEFKETEKLYEGKDKLGIHVFLKYLIKQNSST